MSDADKRQEEHFASSEEETNNRLSEVGFELHAHTRGIHHDGCWYLDNKDFQIRVFRATDDGRSIMHVYFTPPEGDPRSFSAALILGEDFWHMSSSCQED